MKGPNGERVHLTYDSRNRVIERRVEKNGFRYYDPLAAQYISPDPIGLTGGLKSSSYVTNPNAWIDPWGLNEDFM